MNVKCRDIMDCIEEFAPLNLAEEWDNSGLIVGSPEQDISSVLLCLDVTLGAVGQAIRTGADMIVAHHPMIFTPIKIIDTDSVIGRLLRDILTGRISVYCSHTNTDRTYGGLNDLLVGLLGLSPVEPRNSSDGAENFSDGEGNSSDGVGKPPLYRIGLAPAEMNFEELCKYVSVRLKQTDIMGMGDRSGGDRANGGGSHESVGGSPAPGGSGEKRFLRRIAIMSGSYEIEAKELIGENIDTVISGEMKHHQILELNDSGIDIVLAGHHGTERFFINLAEKWIKERYPDLPVQSYGLNDPPVRFVKL